MPTQWKYSNSDNNVVMRVYPDGTTESCIVTRQDVQEWIALGNTPLPADQ